jgi:hypothetical protein
VLATSGIAFLREDDTLCPSACVVTRPTIKYTVLRKGTS